jgi:hypothetical protein
MTTFQKITGSLWVVCFGVPTILAAYMFMRKQGEEQ